MGGRKLSSQKRDIGIELGCEHRVQLAMPLSRGLEGDKQSITICRFMTAE